MDSTYNLNGGFKPTLKRFADLNGPDFYPTPVWATYALINIEDFQGNIWEPACGDGSMAKILKETNCSVESSDLFDRGYGSPGIDFLKTSRVVDNIITNPPFNAAEGFVRAGLKQSSNKLALLLRLAFLEGANRQREIFRMTPPTRVWIFSERITFYPAGAVQKGSGTTAYAWFVWDKNDVAEKSELKWIPLGLKARYSSKSEGENSRNPMLLK